MTPDRTERTNKSRIGFLINPIAGMGGRVGLKGTDDVADEAAKRGAAPVAPIRAAEALGALTDLLRQMPVPPAIEWVTCSGAMGSSALIAAGLKRVKIVFDVPARTTEADTKEAVGCILAEGVDLILFCGGDGTARDICAVVGPDTPILGIPSGVKMYSGVFGVNPEKTAEVVVGFLQGRLQTTSADVLDLDEERYRRGEWAVRLYHAATTPYEPTCTQSAKMLINASCDAEIKQDIADYLCEQIRAEPKILYLLGPGSTLQIIGEHLGITKTLLGIDAIADGRLVGADLNEEQLLDLLDQYGNSRLVLSPIGAQGFVLGRGNLQISPNVVRKVGRENLIVVATSSKLAHTPLLRFDTGCRDLDQELAGPRYIPVIVGYRRRRLVRTAT